MVSPPPLVGGTAAARTSAMDLAAAPTSMGVVRTAVERPEREAGEHLVRILRDEHRELVTVWLHPHPKPVRCPSAQEVERVARHRQIACGPAKRIRLEHDAIRRL